MSTFREPIADPTGYLVFESPTEVRVRSGSPPETITVEVIPFSEIVDPSHIQTNSRLEVVTGQETYYIPEGATFETVSASAEQLMSLNEQEDDVAQPAYSPDVDTENHTLAEG